MFRTLFLSLALAGGSAVTGSAADFKTIDVPGAVNTQARGLNSQGDIAGFYLDAAGTQHGFLLRKGVLYNPIDAPVAGVGRTQIWGINDEGSMVGSYTAPTGTPPRMVEHGFVLGREGFTSFDVPDSTFTGGYAINNEGDVTGHYGSLPAGKMRGYLMRNGKFNTFGAEDWGMPNTMTCGFGINAEGSIVGHFQDATGVHGFLLSKSVFTTFDAGPSATNAYGTNAQGEIVGFNNDSAGKTLGFFRSKWGDFTAVNVPDAIATLPLGINAQGQIVGYFKDSANALHGFVLSR